MMSTIVKFGNQFFLFFALFLEVCLLLASVS